MSQIRAIEVTGKIDQDGNLSLDESIEVTTPEQLQTGNFIFHF